MGTAATNGELEKAEELHSESWETLLPMMSLKSGKPESRKHYFKLNLSERCFTHLRLNIFPDGGVARLRVYGELAQSHGLTNGLSSLKPLRGKCVSFSNAHYGHPDHLLEPGPCEGMYNGWETARRLDRPPKIDVDNTGFMQTKGEEWTILMLEKAVMVNHVEVDTSYFKGNCPDNVKILGAFVEPNQDLKSVEWVTILNQTKLMANQKNGLKHPFIEVVRKPINHVKVIIAPDGGLARVRLYSQNYF